MEIASNQDVRGGSERSKKQWGPILAQRKSKRIQEDGRSALEKAQDCKKKCNLEVVKGTNQSSSLHTNKVSLSSIIVKIGIVSGDGNPLHKTCWITWLI